MKDMNFSKPLLWHQGLYLEPQHLQYLDIRQNTIQYPLMQIANPFFWGVVALDINKSALANDVFEINRATVLMPDGFLINYPDNAQLSSRSFSAAWQDRHQPFTIFLGIKKLNPKGENVTLIAGENQGYEVTTRFQTSAESEKMADFHQNGPHAEIKTLTYVIRLFWKDELESLQDYDVIPIAQIIRDGDEIQESPFFIPPCLHLSSSSILLKTVVEIRDELAGRVRQLEEYKTPMGVVGDMSDTRTIPYRMALQMLSIFAPVLFHYVDTLTVHPWQIYGLFRQLIGGLSTLSERTNFLGETGEEDSQFPAYKHTDLGRCFTTAFKQIIQLLNEITIQAESVIQMNQVEPGKFQADLTKDLLGPKNVFYMVLRTETPIEDFVESFLHFAKTGSAEQVEIFTEKALPGLSVKHLMVQPEGVPRRPNASYFRIDRRDTVWETIEQEKNIVLLWDDAPNDLKVEIIVLGR